ncbi:MAG: hypothetical protein HFI06_11655 [Eubacterium sp.]|nr:hypothetical protein [Eubacterium sp.]
MVRCLLYLAQTYQEYFESTKQNVYGSKKLELPKPEMYVIFTGNRKTRPEYLYLSKEFFGGDDSVLDLKVKMIYDGKEGDIMMTLFSEEYILKTYVESREKEASEKTKIEAAQKLYKKGFSVEDIADTLNAPVKEVGQWLGLVRA